jgi:hypothetical protein
MGLIVYRHFRAARVVMVFYVLLPKASFEDRTWDRTRRAAGT